MTDVTEPMPPLSDGGRPRKLKRSSEDRVLVGVAGGLGAYFGVDPLLFRVGLALSAFFGGFGLFAYLLLAVFVPTDGEPDRAQRIGARLRSLGLWRGLGVAALVVVATVVTIGLAGSAAFAVALGWGLPVAVVTVAAAILALIAAARGATKWLVAPVLALALGAGAAAASNVDLSGGIGERTYQPLSVSEIPADGYRLGVGHLVVDLRRLDWAREPVARVDVEMGMGQAQVLVPAGVCVVASSHVGAGESEVTGERNSGFDVDTSVGDAAAGAGGGAATVPRLVLNAVLDAGQLQVLDGDSTSGERPDACPPRAVAAANRTPRHD